MVEPQIPESLLMQYMPFVILALCMVTVVTVIVDLREWSWKRRLGKILSKIKEI